MSQELIAELDRITIEKMRPWELDAGFSLALGQQTRVVGDGRGKHVEALVGQQWVAFSPTTSWEDFGNSVSRFEIVLGTHNVGDDFERPYYSAHAFLSGTSFDSYKGLRIAAAMAATAYGRLLEWKMVPKVGVAPEMSGPPG